MSDSLAGLAATVYSIALPLSWLVLAGCVVILLPLALFKRTRSTAGAGLFVASWLFGFTTWTLGAALTFSTYGILGLVLGLVFLGVGVVPIGIFAAFVSIKSTSLGLSLIVMSILVFASRFGGLMLAGVHSNE